MKPNFNILLNNIFTHHSGRKYQLTKITNQSSTDFIKFPITAVYHSLDDGLEWSRPLIDFLEKFENDSPNFKPLCIEAYRNYLTYGPDTLVEKFAANVIKHLSEN